MIFYETFRVTLSSWTYCATKIDMRLVFSELSNFSGHNGSFTDSFKGTTTRPSDIGYAFYGGLWAYDGWNNLNYVTEELKNPIRDLPLAIMIGIPLVTGCYVLVNIAYLTVLTAAEVASSNAVAVVSDIRIVFITSPRHQHP